MPIAQPADTWTGVGTLKIHAIPQTVRGTSSDARGTLGNSVTCLDRQMKSAAISGGKEVVQVLDISYTRIQTPEPKSCWMSFLVP